MHPLCNAQIFALLSHFHLQGLLPALCAARPLLLLTFPNLCRSQLFNLRVIATPDCMVRMQGVLPALCAVGTLLPL
jgi:hypothetical protein